ncbi:MAG TPA: hypothetical protein VJ768_05380 [Anaerolineales bacterium]|nr:hypothetical protein [Anaerolineales bacterium]
MRNILRRFLLLGPVLFAAILGFGVAFAKGPPAKVVIEGPGLETPIEISEALPLMAFSLFQFEDVERPIDPPADSGVGYTITRYILDGEKLTPWDRLVYYPGAEGKPGVVYLEGMLSGSSEYDGMWYGVSSDGDAAMRSILSGAGISLAGNEVSFSAGVDQPAAVSSQASGRQNFAIPNFSPALPIALGLGILGAVSLLFLFFRRRRAVAA